jgi:DNA-binding Lrp family transcriptional regulator
VRDLYLLDELLVVPRRTIEQLQGHVRPRSEEALMIAAIMLITTELKAIESVTKALAEMQDVREVYTTTGQYDVVVILHEKDSEALADTVTKRIAQVPGITNTTTLLAIRRYSQVAMERMFGIGFKPVEGDEESGGTGRPREG